MPAPFMTPERVAAAKILQAQGWSLRRIAAVFGCDHQTVYVHVSPEAKAKRDAAIRAYHARDSGRNWRIRRLRDAREQAAEENVAVEVICERWNIKPPRRASPRLRNP